MADTMSNNKTEISNSAKFKKDYEKLLQKVKERFKVKDSKYINISESKASRVLNGQFDIITLIDMADCVGIDVELFFCYRKQIN